jgi:hypothetical protein
VGGKRSLCTVLPTLSVWAVKRDLQLGTRVRSGTDPGLVEEGGPSRDSSYVRTKLMQGLWYLAAKIQQQRNFKCRAGVLLRTAADGAKLNKIKQSKRKQKLGER